MLNVQEREIAVLAVQHTRWLAERGATVEHIRRLNASKLNVEMTPEQVEDISSGRLYPEIMSVADPLCEGVDRF